MKQVCVFCGSSRGTNPEYQEATKKLGRTLAFKNITLVYGGASVGLMGELADSVLEADGKVIGVIPKSLVEKEVAHTGLADLRIVDSMHQRKELMAELADGFIALPGGLGTLEEFIEIWNWGQLGLHHKPYGLLNVAQFYQPLITFLDHMVYQKFLKDLHRSLVLVEESPETLVHRLETYELPQIDNKWINWEET